MRNSSQKIYIEGPPPDIPDNEHLRSYRVLIAALKWELAEKEKLLNNLDEKKFVSRTYDR